MGQHKSPFKGTSVEFVEHRQYYPGDEVRHIDWRAYGKSGKYYIKEFEDETNLRCYILVDASGSMAYGKSTLSKFAYARQLATALAYMLLMQRDAVGLISFDTKVRDRIEPSARAQTFNRAADVLGHRRPGGETGLAHVFRQILPTLKRRSLVVIISDCFDKLELLRPALEGFRHHRHEVLLFQIAAPEEETFPFSKPTQFRSLEKSSQRLLVDPNRLRKQYLEAYQTFCSELKSLAGGSGVDFAKFVTNQPYAIALGEFLASRTKSRAKR